MTFQCRTLLVDDSTDFLKALRRFLVSVTEIEVVGSATSGLEAIGLAEELRPDLVLMDLAMPGVNGLDACQIISGWPEGPRVVIMTSHEPDVYRPAAIAVGADGFLEKSELLVGLLPLIHRLFPRRESLAEERLLSPA